MIQNFRSNKLKKFYTKGEARWIEQTLIRRVSLLLSALSAADDVQEMNVIGYDFHGVKGQPKRYAVKVNKNWRITFGWQNGAIDVDLEDYH